MSVGIGIFLLVLGAVCVWALEFDVAGIDIVVIGYILLAAGAVVTLLSLVALGRGRRTTAVTTGTTAAPGAPVASNGVVGGGVATSERVTEVRHDGI